MTSQHNGLKEKLLIIQVQNSLTKIINSAGF